MELREFVSLVAGFAELSHPERVKHFAWYLHAHQQNDRFDDGAIEACYVAVDMEPPPNVGREIRRLVDRDILLKDPQGFRLEHRTRAQLDKKYADHPTTIMVSQLLKELPGKISDDAERLFLSEALKCYHVQAFRAAIVMTWNLAYDHLLNWILKDAQRIADFNTKIIGKVGAKRGTGLIVAQREDFEELKEREVIDICGTAGLFTSDNIKKVLGLQLTKRNLAAHPSLLEIKAPQADDTIYDLVANVVMKLK
jgi:hypothetical protein